MAKHSARRNIRGGVALGAVLTAIGLTASAAYASAAPGPLPTTCADALAAYNTAQSNEDTDKGKLANARAADNTEDTNVDGTAKTDPAAPGDSKDVALNSAQSTYDADVAAMKAAKAEVNKPVSEGGCAGAPGRKGVDAKIVLAPGVCAQATIKPDTRQLIRVVMLIPCPPVVPPPAPPAADQPVTVIPPAAPAPQTVQNSLPVTH